MRPVLWLLWWLAVAAPAPAAARTLLVVGDSLSAAYGIERNAGWVALLEQRLARERPGYRVVNSSISGDTSAGGLARLPRLLAEHRPQLVVIELGGNDGLRGLAPDQTKNNIRAMIVKSKEAGARVLLLGIELPPNLGPKYTERFRRLYRDLAAEQQVALVPRFLLGIDTDPELMQPDRIHPTAGAQARMLENVWGVLRGLL
jgi:acyl-CoA thioesterase-1